MKLTRFLPLSALAASAGAQSFEQQCNSFGRKVHISNVQVNIVEYVPAGTNLSLPDSDPTCGTPSQVVTGDTCRIAMYVATSNVSGIHLEAFFPSNYTGRVLSTGNGGLGGCIDYDSLSWAASQGFAAYGANNGHNGTSGKPFYQHPETVEDFAYRSVHTGVVVGKQLANLFYSSRFKKSYYLGCSTGGRQGFKSLQRFPKDFDGVVAGAPAFNFVNLISWSAHFYNITGPVGSAGYLSPALWAVVHNEIMRQCDGLDGATDGIIEDTDRCQPDPETLICNPGSNATACLTSEQARTVRRVLSPLLGENGQLLYPRMQPGSEIIASHVMYTGQPFSYSTDWYRYVTYSDPDWDATAFDVHDASVAQAQNPYNIQTWEDDLSPFQRAGGKVLTYHGLADALISSDNSKFYYSRVAQGMNKAPSELDDFYRFFTVGGMGHCGGGTGPVNIGNSRASAVSQDPDDNMLMAMVRWVEEGVAPEYVTGSSLAQDGTVEYQRRHCRWPRRNAYTGPGNYTDPDAWTCIL